MSPTNVFAQERKGCRLLIGRDEPLVALGGQYPLIDALKSNKGELTVTRFRKAQGQARAILDALVSWASSRKALSMEEYPRLNIVRRPLQHRFILPVRPITQNPRVRREDVPGWGRWQPVITSFDDLLTWATANVLATDSARNLGRCEQCGDYYFSNRGTRHRFCPDGDCRDRFWRERTGVERVRRAREKRHASVASRLQATLNHVEGDRRERPH
jgi:hypothetical protein